MSKFKLQIISKSTVLPAASDQHKKFGRRIELTPWDLRYSLHDHIQKGILLLKPTNVFSLITTTLVDHLKATLSQALEIFYPLAGRLAVIEKEDGTAIFFIDCNGAGAHFVHAVIDDVTAADILQSPIVPDDIVYSFFPMKGIVNGEAAFSKLPLLAVQVTEVVDGIFITCTMNHCAGDGESFRHFFNVWSEISRQSFDGSVSQCSRPVFGREWLDVFVSLPISFPFSRDSISKVKREVSPPNLQQRMFRFSKAKIAELKAKANAEMEIITESNEITISSLQALLAHLWMSVTRNRRIDPDEEVGYEVAVGMRTRIQPPLPEGYFGSAALVVMPKCTARELLENGLGWSAWKINRVIASQTATEVRKLLEDWAQRPTLTHIGKYPANTLLTGSSPRFDVYGNDFGWGRPIAVRSGPAAKFDGKLTVFPGAEEGSIEFEVCLLVETLESLACDAEFMASLS